jgi:hypothetical protein
MWQAKHYINQKQLTGLPIVGLMCRDLTFYRFFVKSETRNLMSRI